MRTIHGFDALLNTTQVIYLTLSLLILNIQYVSPLKILANV